MRNERAIICGEATDSGIPFQDVQPLRLRLWGRRNIALDINELSWPVLGDVPGPFTDLIEIATFVYCADQIVSRGGSGVDSLGADWRRRLFFRIPVRHPDLWRSTQVMDMLTSTLGFLSEDEYVFDFTPMREIPSGQRCLFSTEQHIEEVVLFSGGLDSLGGAIQEAVVDKRRIALVTHKATRKLERRHRHLQKLLARHCKDAPLHIAVEINKRKNLGREFTQRTRSFLYMALAGTVAQMLGLSRIRFYENGIVSFNLPPTAQIVGAKATRTTHPQVLKGFAEILSAVADKRFAVENPFLWLTKADIVQLIAKAACTDLIKYTTSCTHTWEMTTLHPHCGVCSQCIDRRFAVLAAGVGDAEEAGPEAMYKVNLLVGERPALNVSTASDERQKGEPRTMVAAYVEMASEVARMSPVEFFSRFGEASRVLLHLDGSPESVGLRLFELHQRHARQVTKVVDDAIATHARAIRERTLPAGCLLRLVCDASAASGPGPIGPATVQAGGAAGSTATTSDYVFRRKGKAWEVRFAGGQDFILLPTKGAAYLHILLSNPRTAFPVTKLVFLVAKAPDQYPLGDAGEASDRDALAAYRAEYERLKDEMETARELGDEERQAKIRADMEFLADHIKRDTGLGGRLRRDSDDRDRVRKAFRARIRAVVQEIAQFDKRLAEHLKPPNLKCGWEPCYDPKERIEWET